MFIYLDNNIQSEMSRMIDSALHVLIIGVVCWALSGSQKSIGRISVEPLIVIVIFERIVATLQ